MPSSPKIEYPTPGKPREVDPPHVPVGAVRARLGMTQTEVCERVEAITGHTFTKGALSAIERGHRGASAEVLVAIQTALGLGPDDVKVNYKPGHSRRPKGDAA